MKRRLLGAVLVTALTHSAVACAPGEESPNGSQHSGTEVVNTAQENDSRTVTDHHGREVEIPAAVDNAAIDGGPTRLVVYAGATDKLTSVAELDQDAEPAMPYAYVNREVFNSLPVSSTGGAGWITYEESIIELNPDVVITSQPDATIVDDLQNKLGIPVVAVAQPGVLSEQTYNSLELLGEVFGTEDRAEEVIAQFKEWEDDLTSRVAEVPEEERPAAYAGAVNFRGSHGFDGTTGNYMPFDVIGATNVAAEANESTPFIVDMEQISEWDPDFIFLNPKNMHLVNQAYSDNPLYFDSLRAVQEGNVYSHPSYNYNYTNIELAFANAYYAGIVMYPDRFADIDIEEKATEIFDFFYGENTLYEDLAADGMIFGPLEIGRD